MSGYPGIVMRTAGASAPLIISLSIVANFQAAPAYGLGLAVTVATGSSLTYSVQLTCDPMPTASGNWNNHDVLVGLTSSANDSIGFPITGIRLNVNSYTAGSVNLGVAQWP